MRRRFTGMVLLAIGTTLLFTKPAWAYLDPGTGSMMLQLLLGGVVGAMVVGKVYWHRFRGFMTSWFSGKPGQGTQTHASTSSKAGAPDE
jgi:hypothetical protein